MFLFHLKGNLYINFIEEMISKSKIEEYFNNFKRENQSFAEENLDLDRIYE